MSETDRLPLEDAPATDRIRRVANNRLGAVYSALYSFWSARHTAVTTSQETTGARRDAYSVIMFNWTTENVVVDDFTSSPDELLSVVLNTQAKGGTNFTTALQAGQNVMVDNWSTERFATQSPCVFRLVAIVTLFFFEIRRTPIMIFLSDGECSVPDAAIQDLCRSAIQYRYLEAPCLCQWAANRLVRKPLSFHAVSFGQEWDSTLFDSTQ